MKFSVYQLLASAHLKLLLLNEMPNPATSTQRYPLIHPFPVNLSNQLCYSHCEPKEGATFFAVAYGYTCWCAFGDEDDFTNTGVGLCDTPCRGEDDMMCGKSPAGIPSYGVPLWGAIQMSLYYVPGEPCG